MVARRAFQCTRRPLVVRVLTLRGGFEGACAMKASVRNEVQGGGAEGVPISHGGDEMR